MYINQKKCKFLDDQDMQGRHSTISIEMHDDTRAPLTGWLRKQKPPVGLAKRARTMLFLADGYAFAATAK